MSTLADIRKNDRLRGSDLSQFNELHPRDQEGQFAAKQTAGSAASRDPRIARQKRRNRRAKITLGAMAAQQRQAAAVSAPQAAQETPSLGDLKSLRREHERPRFAQQRFGQQRKGQESAPPPAKKTSTAKPETETEGGVAIDDRNLIPAGEYGHHISTNLFIQVTPAQAEEYIRTGRLSTYAAGKAWGESLKLLSSKGMKHAAREAYQNGQEKDLMFISVDHGWTQDDDPHVEAHMVDGVTASPQMLISTDDEKSPIARTWTSIGGTEQDVQIPFIMSSAEHQSVVESWQGRPTEFSNRDPIRVWHVNKSADWEDEEHPRDPRGRFADAGGRTGPVDPRKVRQKRRNRRARLAASAQVAHAPTATQADPRVRPRFAQRTHQELALARQAKEGLEESSEARSQSRSLSYVFWHASGSSQDARQPELQRRFTELSGQKLAANELVFDLSINEHQKTVTMSTRRRVSKPGEKPKFNVQAVELPLESKEALDLIGFVEGVPIGRQRQPGDEEGFRAVREPDESVAEVYRVGEKSKVPAMRGRTKPPVQRSEYQAPRITLTTRKKGEAESDYLRRLAVSAAAADPFRDIDTAADYEGEEPPEEWNEKW